MKTQMTKLSLIALTLTMILATSASAVVLLDQSGYDASIPGFLNAVAGGPPFGGTSYSVNDVTVGGTGWVITDISTYYNATGFFESVSDGYLYISPKTGDLPTEDPTNDILVPLTVTYISDSNYQVTASGLNIELSPGEYWIGVTPIAGSLYDGIHLSATTLIGAATPSFDPYGMPAMWTNWNPGVDAAMLINGLDDVVATDDVTLDTVKSLYR
jgi:hypothetical protein